MRESIGGAWILGIVLVFMSIFIAFISISINYSNAYKLKTAMVTTMEQYDGFNALSIDAMEGLMSANGYIQAGACTKADANEKVFGVTGTYVIENPKTRQNYCVRREFRAGKDGGDDRYYYTIEVFFGFNLPVLGDIYTFKVRGETNAIYYPTDPYF